MAEMFEASKLETPNLPDARMSPTTANQISLKKSSFAMLNSMNSFDVADSGKTLDDIYNRDFRVSRLKNARGSMQARITTSAKKTGLRAQLASLGLSVMGFFLSIKPWFKFMFSLLQEISYSVVANPSMFLTSPTNFLILVFGLPHAGAALLVLAPLLYLLLHNRWLINIYNKLSSEQGNLSLINWSDPEMYSNQHDDLIRRAKKTMSAHRSTAETKDSAKFNIDVARWLLLVSGIMYERDTNKALEATKAYYESQDDHSLSFAGLRTQEDIKNFVRSKQGDKDETFSMVSSNGNYHFRPESRIEQQTRIWDVHFRPISHMKRLYSPFAGIWWNSGQDPFIIVAFKGTTPVDYSEFLVDASFQKTDASAFLWGNCHQGFYDAIFPDAYDSSLHGGGNEESPYGSLIQAIRIKAKELHAAIKEKYPYIKIPVYVTGHSLGAAMASLFYARLLKAPHDLGPLVDIRQAYVYGCPAVGDVEFAQGFASEINSSYSNHFGLWRVIDDSDIVTRLPLNFSNPLSGRPSRNPFVKHGSLVDYCVIGNGVRVFGDGREPQVCWKMPRSANVFEMSDPTTAPLRNPFKGVINWAKKFIHGGNAMRVELACPKPIRDHFPTEYFRNLSKSENYFKFHDELFAK